jgi:hypothetical protein
MHLRNARNAKMRETFGVDSAVVEGDMSMCQLR